MRDPAAEQSGDGEDENELTHVDRGQIGGTAVVAAPSEVEAAIDSRRIAAQIRKHPLDEAIGARRPGHGLPIGE